MGLFDKLRHELIEIIEWMDSSRETLVWRFPRHQNEIKNGAQLIVRPGQLAIMVHRGKLADVFEPGNYKLSTDNLPILSTLLGWKHGFNSPFRSEIYFISTIQVTHLKWGTPNPIMLRDPDFGPIRLRAFGSYTLKAQDAQALLTELVGTDAEFDVSEINELIRSIINSSLAEILGTSQISALDLASNYEALSQQLRQHVAEKVDDEYGLEIPQLFIVNISLPEEVEKALDTSTSMSVIGDMRRFQQYHMGQAMTTAAGNPAGGGAADGMGMGMGLAMANQMMQGMNQPSAVPPPVPQLMFHIVSGGQKRGPYTMAQLTEAVSEQELTPTTLVWTAGMTGWSPASEVPQLSGLFPPPVPPA
jgi:membrane protease subunit (stomatin/prohibitin family)